MATVTSSGKATVTLPTDTQILITRGFDAPPRLVYRAYTTPELIERWWSGERGEVTKAEVDLRVGGTWRYVMDNGAPDKPAPPAPPAPPVAPTPPKPAGG